MENRRQYYRLGITPNPAIQVTFRAAEGTDSFTGEIVNLSIGGICVRSEMMEAASDQSWIATFSLRPHSFPLSIPVERVYTSEDQQGYGGFRFLPLGSPRDLDEQERTISRFLLDEQSRLRREAQQANRPTGETSKDTLA